MLKSTLGTDPKATADFLPPLTFHENWRVKDIKPERFLLARLGDQLEEIAISLADAGTSEKRSELSVGRAAEIACATDFQCAVRFIARYHGPHYAKVDVILRRQGADLYVAYHASARSMLLHLRLLFMAWLFLVLWSVGFWLLLNSTNAFGALVQEYARRNFGDMVTAKIAIEEGWKFDAQTQEWFPGPRTSLLDMLSRDPALVITSLGALGALIAALAGAAVAFAPPSLFHGLCRWLDWPAPVEFESFVAGHTVWTACTFSVLMQRQFGVDETQRIALSRNA